MSDSWRPHGLYSPWNSLGQNTGVGSLSLLQGIFPTQGLSPGLPHCRRILYQLRHMGSPRILKWVACHFSRDLASNWGLLHCRQILYQLNYQGSPFLRVSLCICSVLYMLSSFFPIYHFISSEMLSTVVNYSMTSVTRHQSSCH